MGLIQGIADYRALIHHFRHFDQAAIAGYQLRAVQNLTGYARQHSPFYRRLYAGRTIDSLTAFAALPTINKQIMMDNFDELNTRRLKLAEVSAYAVGKELARDYTGYYQGQYVVGLSSGTSGSKGIYVTPKDLTRRLPFVFLARSGIPLRLFPFRILFLLRVFSQGFQDINAPGIRLKYLSTMTEPDAIIQTLNRELSNVLMAPPSLLRVLLPVAGQIRVKPGIIVTYAEVLTAADRAMLSRVFGAPVIQIYQASEGQIASSCRYGNLHLNEDLVLAELFDADQRPVEQPGQAAKLLVTNLVNRVQPLIRYEMNDLIVLGEPCPCGSRFRMVQAVLGRQDDVLHFTNRLGRRQPVFPDLFSRWIITASEAIREFKVVQAGENLTITLDLLAGGDTAQVQAALQARLNQELGELGIDGVWPVFDFRPIGLPADQSKYKRFEKR